MRPLWVAVVPRSLGAGGGSWVTLALQQGSWQRPPGGWGSAALASSVLGCGRAGEACWAAGRTSRPQSGAGARGVSFSERRSPGRFVIGGVAFSPAFHHKSFLHVTKLRGFYLKDPHIHLLVLHQCVTVPALSPTCPLSPSPVRPYPECFIGSKSGICWTSPCTEAHECRACGGCEQCTGRSVVTPVPSEALASPQKGLFPA